MARFTFTGVILKEGGVYSSFCPEVDVASVGDTPEAARSMLLEAVTLHLEGAIEDGLPVLRAVPPDADPRRQSPHAVVDTFQLMVDVAVQAHAWPAVGPTKRGRARA